MTNVRCKELLYHVYEHKKEESVTYVEVFALLYKYWEAECGEQEIGEDLSQIMDPEYIFEAKELIRICDPSELEDEYKEGYRTYVQEITDEETG